MERIFDGFISSEDNKHIPHPKEPVIGKDEIKAVIYYNGRIFEIHHKEINYLSILPKILEERLKLSKDKGMMFIYPDGWYGCHYCSHYNWNIKNIAEIVMLKEQIITHNKDESACGYQTNGNIKNTTIFKNKESGLKIIAQEEPCIVSEATIETLVENGKLDRYEVFNKKFDYLTLNEADRLYNEGSLPEKFIVNKKKPKLNLFKRLKDYFSKK